MTDITTPRQGSDRDTVLLIIGGACVGAGVAALGQVPGVRDAVSRIVGGPGMREAAWKAFGVLASGVAAVALNQPAGIAASPSLG